MFDQIKLLLTPYCKIIGIPDDWLSEVDFWIFLCTVLCSGILLPLLVYSVKLIEWIILRRQQHRHERDLHPWYTAAEIDWATRFYVPTHYQNVSPSQDDEPGRRFIASARNPLIPLFLKKVFGHTGEDNKYYLILADSGMGKSTFMINLYLAYKQQWHFFKPKFNIKLLPLGHPHALEELDKMEDKEKGNTILLLDAFDEGVKALHNYQARMEEILQKSWRFREVVITCRTQFFPSREEEPYETGYYKFGGAGGDFKFQKLYLSVFDDTDVRRYLRKRYNIFNPFKWKCLYRAWRITQKSPNLVVRPMLLSHIEDLVKENREYEFVYQIYEVLIQKWIERESKKPGIRDKYGSIEVFQQKLEAFSRHLALDMYHNREVRGGLFIPKDQVVFSDAGVVWEDLFEKPRVITRPSRGFGVRSLSPENHFERPSVAIRDSEWRTRSLLNRNAEGQYKFAHKSILEYFLAEEVFRSMAFAGVLDFEGIDAVKGFCAEMMINALRCVDGNFTMSKSKTTYPLSKLNHKNFIRISNLTIKSIEGVPIMMLKDYLPKSISSVAIFDKKSLLIYYELFDIYILFLTIEEKKKLWELLGFSIFFESFKLSNPTLIEAWRKLQELADLWKLLESMDLQFRLGQVLFLRMGEVVKLRDQIERKEIAGGFERQEHIRKDLFAKLSARSPIVLSELKAANEFIKQCKNLQEAMPNTKIYY